MASKLEPRLDSDKIPIIEKRTDEDETRDKKITIELIIKQ